MRDPVEGLNPDETIRTGVARRNVGGIFGPTICDVVQEFERKQGPTAELHLYGSVGTGAARPGTSDVDLLTIGATAGWAEDAATRFSQRYGHLCRGVGIATSQPLDYVGASDESYGNRVFLRHYRTSLAGPDASRPATPFSGDARAARGFNGDIATHLARWRTGGAVARHVARKTLVAAAGIVSVRLQTWTTDRGTAVEAWKSIDVGEQCELRRLLGWAESNEVVTDEDLVAALATDGIVGAVANRFADDIGLWR